MSDVDEARERLRLGLESVLRHRVREPYHPDHLALAVSHAQDYALAVLDELIAPLPAWQRYSDDCSCDWCVRVRALREKLGGKP